MRSVFANRLQKAMEKSNLTQTELSYMIGASKSAISQYLSGLNVPGEKRMKAIADATGVTVGFLRGDDTTEEEATPFNGRITPRQAARCLGKSEQFIRMGLQDGRLPFGCAVQGIGDRWNYDIRPNLFREYVGAEIFDNFFKRNI